MVPSLFPKYGRPYIGCIANADSTSRKSLANCRAATDYFPSFEDRVSLHVICLERPKRYEHAVLSNTRHRPVRLRPGSAKSHSGRRDGHSDASFPVGLDRSAESVPHSGGEDMSQLYRMYRPRAGCRLTTRHEDGDCCGKGASSILRPAARPCSTISAWAEARSPLRPEQI